jgi:hypothetical protein
MKSPRHIVVKTLLNADEFLAFSEQCEAEDVTQSKQLRDMLKSWVADKRNGTERRGHGERAGRGQNLSMLLPGRPNFTPRASLHMRL